MNTGVEVALLVPVAYLLGTFPSATLVARRRGVDVTAEGSGNPGASNTFRLLGWKAGALVFAWTSLKGAIAAARRARRRRPPRRLRARRRRGPRPRAPGHAEVQGRPGRGHRRRRDARDLPGAHPRDGRVVGRARARITHKASIASVTVAIAFPIAVALAGHEAGDIIVIAVLALLVVRAPLSNLRRLVRGEELGLDPGTERDEPPDVGDERAAS